MDRPLRFAVITCLAAGGSPLWAQPFETFDPRILAMGGAGVAAATPASAPFFNPALLAASAPARDFDLHTPTITARVSDKGKARDEVDEIDELINRLDDRYQAAEAEFEQLRQSATLFDLLTGFRRLNQSLEREATLREIQRLERNLEDIDDDRGTVDAFAGLSVGVPGERFGVGVFASDQLYATAEARYADADRIYLDAAQAAVRIGGVPLLPPEEALQSSIEWRGATLLEAGVSFAFAPAPNWAIGVTPKYQRVETFDYRQTVADADLDIDEGNKDFDDMNVDVGLAGRFGGAWRAGLVAKNLASRTYDTVRGNEIELQPQLRAGIAYEQLTWTLTADVDVLENDPLGTLDSATQYVSVGGEVRAVPGLWLRAGARTNLADNQTSETIGTVGLGLAAGPVQLDLAAGAGDEEYVAGLRGGVRF